MEACNNENGVILITGAGGGLGCELVDELLTSGHKFNVVCQYRAKAKSVKLRSIMEKHGMDFDTHCFQTELTHPDAVKELHAHASKFGKMWGIVNLAGASANAMSWKMSVTDFSKIIDANLLTTFIVCKEFIPELRERAGGRIINTSSVVAFSGAAGASSYCAAKAGIVGLTRAIALELAPKNVTANVMALGYFDKGLIEHLNEVQQDDIKSRTPLRRLGSGKEIGGLVNYLLSDDAAFMTGQVLHLNGGYHL